MSDFDTRFGYVPPKADLADTDMPDSLRSGLWDAVSLFFLSNTTESLTFGVTYTKQFRTFCRAVWFGYFRETQDSIPEHPRAGLRYVRSRFFEFEFFDVYRFLEFCCKLDAACWKEHRPRNFSTFCNKIFERERCAFRFAESTLVKISDPFELEEISASLAPLSPNGVRTHIERAAQLYSQSQIGDYRNSIKEAISAVESAVAFVAGEKPNGVSRPLRSLGETFNIHPAMREGFEKLYAFTSDSEGVRHAILDQPTIGQAEARYMLISCSCFSNFLLAKHAEFKAQKA